MNRIEELEQLEPADFHCDESRSYALELLKALKKIEVMKLKLLKLREVLDE
ncbi:hypothetical protein [Shewanella sp.]|uniref:hypothetical protein n=1 Tax=Shewanella sp. TaxID=50422 RepID=UPI0040489083